MVDFRLKRSVMLYDALHGFRAGRCAGIATLEAKLAQQLVGISHKPLFQIFLDVRKAYDSLDRGRCMEILRGYVMVQNTARLISHHWDSLTFVPEAKSFLGTAFGIDRGFTQRYLVSPMIFNILVDAAVRTVLEVLCGPHWLRHGMGWAAGEHNLVFYADDRRIARREHIWVQDALVVTVAML